MTFPQNGTGNGLPRKPRTYRLAELNVLDSGAIEVRDRGTFTTAHRREAQGRLKERAREVPKGMVLLLDQKNRLVVARAGKTARRVGELAALLASKLVVDRLKRGESLIQPEDPDYLFGEQALDRVARDLSRAFGRPRRKTSRGLRRKTSRRLQSNGG